MSLTQSYVGGVYEEQGLEAVRCWLEPLFRPYMVEAYRVVRVQHGLPPTSDYTHDQSSTTPNMGIRMPFTPTWSTPPPSRIAASIGHLSLFNQLLQQKSKTIEWVYSDSAGAGTRTTPIWIVKAMVENECLGRGQGSTKKAAKNEAAKEGLVKLGVYESYVPSSAPTLKTLDRRISLAVSRL